MSAQVINSSLIKIRNWLKWRRLIGLVLIVVGLILISSFVKPYLYYMFAPASAEAGYSLATGGNRIFIPSIKLDDPLFENAKQLDHGIIISNGDKLGKLGNVIFEGHNIARDGPLFSLLNYAKVNDEIILHFKGKRYVYRINKRMIVKPEIKDRYMKTTNDKRLTLITCYPPTTTAMRLVLIAKPIK